MSKNKQMCRGCHNDFYNQPGNSTTDQCWSYPHAKVVTRTRVGTWQEPPYTWNPQKILDCFYAPGTNWIKRDDVRISAKKQSQSA